VRWLELASRVDAEAVEAVSEVFASAAGGVSIEPDLVPGPDDGYALGATATVRAYLPLDEATSPKTRKVEVALWHLRAIWPVGELETREVAEEDWASAWKEHFKTFRAGRRIVIRPSWRDYAPEPDDVVVSLDPGAAFGTGLHPTTRRCLELLESTVRPGDRVLDVGTGSGILALAAVGLGAEQVVAVDVDPIAVDVARTNVALNQATDRIAVEIGSADAPAAAETYDVVVANIIARVIVALAPSLSCRLAPTGRLVVGGIIAERADEVAGALAEQGLEVERFVDGDWVAMRARRGRAADGK
jgi:ribosomal protein L11 methyltransferase